MFTDKTGTLTDDHIGFDRAIDPSGEPDDDVLALEIVCNEATVTEGVAVGGNSLDIALWETPAAESVRIGDFRRIAVAPFDHERRCVSVLVFARVSPGQMARIVDAQRSAGSAVAFLGDWVNDALALHHADVGISVDSASDVAKDAADIILLERDLGVVADGVEEGRRIFANTIKYVLMGTSSNFGNMFSVTAAAAFLPMLPFQILLNNLLYDTSRLAIPTDHVDAEQLTRPSHWDIAFIRRFMIRFEPISSLYDFATFAIMLWVFHAAAPLFRAGWFVESLATQCLIVFVIRTRRIPFVRSRPSRPLLFSVLAVVGVGVGLAIPNSPRGSATLEPSSTNRSDRLTGGWRRANRGALGCRHGT